ncbi:MAG: hypothetical protein WBF99_12285 [Xanthobacteraceae bacterium]
MKYQKPSDAEMARRAEVQAIRNRHYERVAAGEVSPVVEETEPAASGLTVGKGPRGKFYVKRGKEIVSGPYETEDEAKARAV